MPTTLGDYFLHHVRIMLRITASVGFGHDVLSRDKSVVYLVTTVLCADVNVRTLRVLP